MAVISERFDSLGLDDPTKTYRLGIMGGTFDPIHVGHLASAEQVREHFELDCVLFIPTFDPVFKQGSGVSDATDRLTMCRLAVEDNPYFDVSAVEIDRGGTTYTIDTLRQLREHYPSNVEIYFITGADTIISILKWKDREHLGDLARFIAVTRPGYIMTDAHRDRIDQAGLNLDISYFEITALNVSSSALRSRLSNGKSIRYLTPLSVMRYIAAKGLYEGTTLYE